MTPPPLLETLWRGFPFKGLAGAALVADGDRGRRNKRLVNDAVTFGQFHQRRDLFPVGVGVEVETEPDVAEPDRHFLVDAKGAAEIEIAFGVRANRSSMTSQTTIGSGATVQARVEAELAARADTSPRRRRTISRSVQTPGSGLADASRATADAAAERALRTKLEIRNARLHARIVDLMAILHLSDVPRPGPGAPASPSSPPPRW